MSFKHNIIVTLFCFLFFSGSCFSADSKNLGLAGQIISGTPDNIIVQNNYAYVAAGGVFTISDPLTSVRKNRVKTKHNSG